MTYLLTASKSSANRYDKNKSNIGPKYRLANQYMRELPMLHFSKRIVLLNCVLVNVASIALIDILNALSPSLKDSFQFFSKN
jgi:hypothetical protein